MKRNALLILVMSLFLISCDEKITGFNQCDIQSIEVSIYRQDEYHPVSSKEDLIKVINTAKKVPAKFIPRKEIRVTLDNDQFFYVYLSETCRYLKVNGTTFVLSRKQAAKLLHLLESN